MQQSASMLQDLADTMSRGQMDTVDVPTQDVPTQLRRIAASLEGGAAAMRRVCDLSSACSWQGSFLLYFRNEVHRMRMQLHHKLRDEHDEERLTWPPEYSAKLSEMEDLLRVLFEICGELADSDYLEAGGSAKRHSHMAVLGSVSAAPQYS